MAVKTLTDAEEIRDDAGRLLGRITSYQLDDQPRPYWAAQVGRERTIRGVTYTGEFGRTHGGRYDAEHGRALRTRAAAIEFLRAWAAADAQHAADVRRNLDLAAELHAASPVWQAALHAAGSRAVGDRGQAE